MNAYQELQHLVCHLPIGSPEINEKLAEKNLLEAQLNSLRSHQEQRDYYRHDRMSNFEHDKVWGMSKAPESPHHQKVRWTYKEPSPYTRCYEGDQEKPLDKCSSSPLDEHRASKVSEDENLDTLSRLESRLVDLEALIREGSEGENRIRKKESRALPLPNGLLQLQLLTIPANSRP